MDFVVQALGEGAGAGAADGAYDREADLEDAWTLMGKRPRLVVFGPNLANPRYNIWHTTFGYHLSSTYAWPPSLLVRAIREAYEARHHPNALMVQLVAELRRDPLGTLPPFPNEDEAPPALARALPDIQRHLDTIWSTPLVPPDRLEWAGLEAMVSREDHYDAAQDILSAYGNRVSRIVFTIREFVAPKGRGADGARLSLALPPRAIADIPASPPYCGQACLAYALAEPVLRGNMRGRPSTATTHAMAMAEKLGVPGAMGLGDFDGFAATYHARVVILVDKTEVLYVASPEGIASVTIYLLLHKDHYFFINDIDIFSRPSERSSARWCHACLASYTPAALRNHTCLDACCSCSTSFADLAERAAHMAPPPIPACRECGARFAGAGCVLRHRCRRWACPLCRLKYPPDRAEEHVCHERYCERCRFYYSEMEGHRCFIQPLKARGPETRPLWAFDLECARGPEGAQVITVAVFRRLFADRELVVCRGEDELFAFLETRAGKGIFFSHNGAKYDTFLIFHHLLLRSASPPRTTFCGLKLLRLEWRGASFLDSFRHLGLSLESCARSFGIPLKKGFFPYDFYSVENAAYVGAPPDVSFFTPHTRSDPEFDDWYYFVWLSYFFFGTPYSIADECVRYCIQDVDILAGVLEHYRTAALEATGVDPLGKATVASFAMAAFRSRYLPTNSIATLLPDEDAFARRGLKGGRTDARQVLRYWGAEDLAAGRFGRYADVNSLYPWVLKTCPLPWGAPSWEAQASLVDAEAYLVGLPADAAALIECDVDCPRDLHHPVLVSTDADGRLRASLEPKRKAVFTSCELQAALARGYRVTRAYRALRFATATGALFGGYIDFYYELKKKAGAAKDLAAYALSKIMMNSLWGKFAQRPIDGDVLVYKEPNRWYQDLTRASAGVFSLTLKAEAPEYLLAERSREGPCRRAEATNSALAAFVTAHARLKLYEALEALGERVIYHDTDSVIYDGVPDDLRLLPHGDSLGLWKDECAGSPIVRVCCLGPKTYAYLRADGVEVVKCKGFSSPFTLSEYEAVAAAFFADGRRLSLSQPELRFVRSLGGGVSVVPGFKTMLPLMDKVLVLGPGLTRPLGFAL